VALDASLCAITVWLAFYLRLDEWVHISGNRWFAVAGSLAIALPLFVVFGLYRAIFRFAGAATLITVTRAIAIYGILYATIFTVIRVPDVPRTVGIIQPVLLLIAVAASRVFVSYWLGGHYRRLLERQSHPKVLIYGAGASGRQLAVALLSSGDLRPVGFVDDDVTLQGNTINNLPVHAPSKIQSLVKAADVSDILLAIPSATRRRRNEILEELRAASVAVRTLPAMNDLAKGNVAVSDLRELDVEDILGRETVPPDIKLLGRNITGKVVLITGAGGSIGGELSRQIAKLGPRAVLLFDMNEFNLYTIHQELVRLEAAEDRPAPEFIPLLGSVCDRQRLIQVVSAWKPDTIFHAAAYKHVPLVEHNLAEGIRNNVFGTLCLAEVANEYEVKDFVLISTDKAVRPTNVMGATKRLSEMILQCLACSSDQTRFCMVRFGNVLGSSGSVVPLFREQIRNGGPVTVTDPEMTRYFMTIPEAAELVIQASAMAAGGEVFVLDMGDPVQILDMAKKMIELSGLSPRDEQNPHGDIEITFVGLRPGEKLYEELLIGNDPMPTDHPRIMKAHELFPPWPVLSARIETLRMALKENDFSSLHALLRELVPDYQPEAGPADWVHLRWHARAAE
jgi:FlaA1/EpsC-like NDP-sugar epimerase